MEQEFVLFGPAHLSCLGMTVLLIPGTVWIGRRGPRWDTANRAVFTALLYGAEGIRQIDLLTSGDWNPATSLPLHLCSVTALLTPVLLWTRSKRLFMVMYFWAFVGTVQALATPDLIEGFPHLRFFRYMVTHAFSVIGVAYVALVDRMRPRWPSISLTFLVTNAYMLLVLAPLNQLIGSNYMLLCHKPEAPTLLDSMGPWPWYIATAEVFAVALFLLLYAPFALWDRCDRR